MKELFIIRHAKSSWDNFSIKDFDRPLNERGLKAAPEMGRRLNEVGIIPELIVSSTAVRSLTTAQLIESSFEKNIEIRKESELYHASTFLLLKKVNEFHDKFNKIFLVGHNPGLSLFVDFLTDEGFCDLPTCAVVGIKFDLQNWSHISSSMGEVILYDYPKKQN